MPSDAEDSVAEGTSPPQDDVGATAPRDVPAVETAVEYVESRGTRAGLAATGRGVDMVEVRGGGTREVELGDETPG